MNLRWVAIGLVVALAGCSDDGRPTTVGPTSLESPRPTQSPQPEFDPQAIDVELEVVARGFDQPLLVTHADDGSDRLFVVEQGGVIWIIEDGRVRDEPFLDISDLTEAQGEQGLLGLAFAPDYDVTRRLFVNYTDLDGNTVIAEYRVTESNRDRVDAGSARVILRIEQPFSNHNGGNLVFGPGDYLYIGMGDGGSAGDPMGNGQRLDTLLGKMLRIDVDRSDPYGSPPDNPFADRAGARPEIWMYGLRNPWRYSFDAPTNTIWIADVGQSAQEEINRLDVAEAAGANLGWNVMEGNACYEPPSGCDRAGLVEPIATYGREDGCSVTGGHVYRGAEFPELVGGYFLSDYCSGKLWVLDASSPAQQELVELLNTERAISSFGLDESGELYLTDHASGEILRIVAD